MTGPFATLTPLTLASASPRRRELLAALGFDFAVVPSRASEPPPEPGEPPTTYAARMAETKAVEVATRTEAGLVLGADTVVALPDPDKTGRVRIMGKPADEAEAREMLRALSGREHVVVTGCCLLKAGATDMATFAMVTRVTMRASTDEELAAYVATGEPMDKAGAYAIQGRGAFLVSSIAGSYANVVGLPVTEILEALLARGAVRPARR